MENKLHNQIWWTMFTGVFIMAVSALVLATYGNSYNAVVLAFCAGWVAGLEVGRCVWRNYAMSHRGAHG